MQAIVDGLSPNAVWPSLSIKPTKIIIVLVAVMCITLTVLMNPIKFRDFKMEELVVLFARLIAIALFVERTVEVLLTPFRGLGSCRIAARLKQAKASVDKGETDSVAEMSNCEDELREYKGKTRQIAFLMSLALGMMISAVGLRGLQFFVDMPSPASEPGQTVVFHALHLQNVVFPLDVQTFVFHTLDVLLTGALLAGKAEGLHKMGLVWTSYLDKSAEKVKGAP